MELSRKSCRLCLSETEFNVSLFGNHSQKTNLVNKILVCLKIVIEDDEFLNTICYKCTENVERYYDFAMFIKKSQMKLVESKRKCEKVNREIITSYVQKEKIFDADCTFSFLEVSRSEDIEAKPSSSLFSYFSPPNILNRTVDEPVWKKPKPRSGNVLKPEVKQQETLKMSRSSLRSRHHSRDLFESQSQDNIDEADFKTIDWNLTPGDSIIKRIKNKCFGSSDF